MVGLVLPMVGLEVDVNLEFCSSGTGKEEGFRTVMKCIRIPFTR